MDIWILSPMSSDNCMKNEKPKKSFQPKGVFTFTVWVWLVQMKNKNTFSHLMWCLFCNRTCYAMCWAEHVHCMRVHFMIFSSPETSLTFTMRLQAVETPPGIPLAHTPFLIPVLNCNKDYWIYKMWHSYSFNSVKCNRQCGFSRETNPAL